MRRALGAAPPWTDNPILARHRFTNAYRASDRVSQYLIRHVIYEGDQAPDEVFFRTMLFKLFNRIETWEELTRVLGGVRWRGFSLPRAERALEAMRAHASIYSGAYIMPSPAFGGVRKHTNHLRLVEHMMKDKAPRKVADARSLEEVFQLLRGYPSLGDFLAFQLTIDMNYGPVANFSEMDFVVAGPGARDGIRKCFADTAGLSESDVIRLMADRAPAEFEQRGLVFPDLWGRPLQLIDCQNLFCEVDEIRTRGPSRVLGHLGPDPHQATVRSDAPADTAVVPAQVAPSSGGHSRYGTGVGTNLRVRATRSPSTTPPS